MVRRGPPDDLRTEEVPVAPPNAEEFAEAPRTVLDDRAFSDLEIGAEPEPAAAPAPDVAPDAAPDAAAPADPIHALPTQQISVRRGSGSITRLSASATATSSPVEAMKLDEVARTRVFLQTVFALCAGGIIVVLSTAGDHVAKVVVLIGSIGAALGALVVLGLTRDPARYQPSRLVVPALLIVFGSMSGVYYWGAGSPVAAMLVYGIYFFSLGADRRVTTAMYALVAATHGVLGLGIMTGVLADHGVVRIDRLPVREQLAIVCIIEALYFLAYYTARVSQRVTFDAMGKLEQAVRGNAQRDALLAEARAELDRALRIGGPGRFTDQVVGSFRLGVLIGRGGIGEVYEALAVADRREAAVKLLHPGTLAEPIHVQRFLREAEIASRLDCPHVVRVLEVGTTASEIPFLAMERLRGSDLAAQLRRQRRLALPATKVLVDQVAIGLEAARIAGIVHRDLKPHNVFFAEDGGLRRWKILDFGVSKAGGSGTLTQGHVVGTPAYMAPEQARGEDVDHRADVYSLAAIIFRAVTGHPVFSGKDVPSTLYDVVYRVAMRPSALAELPPDVDRVLALGLAKDPRERFGFALELARWFSAAVAQGLDHDQRRRADDLIARTPWGASLGAGGPVG
ncbi:MAG TPA: serine/threonine-protein kinase [Kofleriaceae bacterium]|nr:serine/threonine-protein kinase [Kofleriaceae bacterium]